MRRDCFWECQMRAALLTSLCLMSLFATAAFALSPSDLTPPMTSQESAYYETIKDDPTAGESFLVTRDYVRKAEAVVNGSLAAASFPPQKPKGFTVKYLLPDDPAVINKALGM